MQLLWEKKSKKQSNNPIDNEAQNGQLLSKDSALTSPFIPQWLNTSQTTKNHGKSEKASNITEPKTNMWNE